MKKNYFKYISVVMAIVLCVGLFAGCGQVGEIEAVGDTKPGDFPLIVNEVTISQKPSKVAVLDGDIADAIVAMGYETSLSLASEDCTQIALETLTKIDRADTQGIVAAGPDLILANSFSSAEEEAFTAAGILYVTVDDAQNRETFEQMYIEIGSCFGGAETGRDRGLAQAQDIFSTLDDIQRLVPSDRITTAVYLFDESRAITGDDFATTLMSYAGVTNSFTSHTNGEYTMDDLISMNPQIIFATEAMAEKLRTDEAYSELFAVENDQVFAMSESRVEFKGRTIITTATEIVAIAYPELNEPQQSSETEYTGEEEASSEMEINDDPQADPTAEPAESSESEAESEPESTTETETYETLEFGDVSEDVLKMQDRLQILGYITDEYIGEFNEATRDAVEKFQEMNEIEVTGIADSQTLEIMYSDLAIFAN